MVEMILVVIGGGGGGGGMVVVGGLGGINDHLTFYCSCYSDDDNDCRPLITSGSMC